VVEDAEVDRLCEELEVVSEEEAAAEALGVDMALQEVVGTEVASVVEGVAEVTPHTRSSSGRSERDPPC
jgi:hypothetical protein